MTVTSADAVDRETAWLTTSGDGLPGLLASVGGPWDLIQAYQPRTPNRNHRSIHVLRHELVDDRFADIQRMATHQFLLRINWPILAGSGSAEEEQRALDAAIALVVQRIVGPQLDKTHGNRFQSVAENPAAIRVSFTDPEQTIPHKHLAAQITYAADDFVTNA